jgi:hypothetical protein
MPISLSCPKCKKRFSTPDQYAGKKAKCSQCGQIMVVPTPRQNPTSDLVTEMLDEEFGPAPSSPNTAAQNACPSCRRAVAPGSVLCVNCGYDFGQGKVRQLSRPAPPPKKQEVFATGVAPPRPKARSRSAAGSPRSMRLVRVGLIFRFWALLANFALLLIYIVLVVGAIAAAREVPQEDATVFVLGECGVALGCLVGNIFCLFVPGESGARGKIFIVVALDLLLLTSPFWLVMASALLDIPPAPLGLVLGLILMLVPVIEAIVFLLFLSSLATYIDQPGMRATAEEIVQTILFVVGSALASAMVVGAILFAGFKGLIVFAFIFSCLWYILTPILILFVLYKSIKAVYQYSWLLRLLIKDMNR